MFINQTVAKELYNDAGETRFAKAKEYIKQKRVSIEHIDYENMNNFSVSSLIDGNYDEYKVHISLRNGELDIVRCECEDYKTHYGACDHIIATMLEIDGNPKYSGEQHKVKPKERYSNFSDLINTFYGEEMKLIEDSSKTTISLDKNVNLIPKIIFDSYSKEMKIEFKIGTKKQLYKLRDLVEFYNLMINKEQYKYGAKLNIIHEEATFDKDDIPILKFIMKYAETIKYVNNNSNSIYRYYGKVLNTGSIVLSNTAMDEIFEILQNKIVNMEKEYINTEIEFVDTTPDIKFELEKIDEKEYKLICNIDTYGTYEIIDGKEYIYFLMEGKLYRCSKNYKETTLKLLDVFKRNYTREIKFSKNQMSNFFSIVLPKVQNSISLDTIEEEEIEKYMPKKLGVKVYLEFNENNYIVARVIFCYEEEEFNPLEEKPNTPRDVIEEAESLNIFRKTGFMLDKRNSKFILVDDDKIYNFLSQDINEYMQKFEVLATDDFKDKQIKKPKLGTIGVKIENNLLSVDVENFNFDKEELREIIEKYRLKKKYHRLKNGNFLTLEENEDINFLDNLISGAGVNYKELETGKIKLPIYRSLYLDRIMNKFENTTIKKDESYQEIISDMKEKTNIIDEKLPISLNETLREYQKIGFKWLKTLDYYQFGGILADDMGLGKTLQVIAVVLAYIENCKENKLPIMVVCPSSLSLNWKAEIEKFANSINSMVISGNANIRKDQIKNIQNYDVIITSYDLLKRDIALYEELNYEFRYIIADEAQYMKNSNTQNAKSIKKIKAKTKYALTGTPIENSLSELWSIFDFLMPGYLFSYNKFREKFEVPIIKNEDTETMNKLRMLIEPFVLRRTKKQVLTELPDKTVTILNNEMEEEQQKIYLTYLAEAKEELNEDIKLNGYENSHIQILSALTRLRQICCHPSMFLDNYNGESSKLNQCIEIIKDAIASGHKILLFSTYTSMFEIIEKELNREQIQYLKLTGQTKVDKRIELVDEFNKNKDIKVFLISLKAGRNRFKLNRSRYGDSL